MHCTRIHKSRGVKRIHITGTASRQTAWPCSPRSVSLARALRPLVSGAAPSIRHRRPLLGGFGCVVGRGFGQCAAARAAVVVEVVGGGGSERGGREVVAVESAATGRVGADVGATRSLHMEACRRGRRRSGLDVVEEKRRRRGRGVAVGRAHRAPAVDHRIRGEAVAAHGGGRGVRQRRSLLRAVEDSRGNAHTAAEAAAAAGAGERAGADQGWPGVRWRGRPDARVEWGADMPGLSRAQRSRRGGVVLGRRAGVAALLAMLRVHRVLEVVRQAGPDGRQWPLRGIVLLLHSIELDALEARARRDRLRDRDRLREHRDRQVVRLPVRSEAVGRPEAEGGRHGRRRGQHRRRRAGRRGAAAVKAGGFGRCRARERS
mmetsp:Transcript_398/g.619  ORF Transcript_398/g.619 Transcript_398/m.619 type:complete len:375 (+) Transcript_398:436-1560(+)